MIKTKDAVILILVVILLSLFIGCHAAYAGQKYRWPVLRVIDGDTVKVRINSMPRELQLVSVRINGVDTPEKGRRAKCSYERELSKKAKAFTSLALEQAKDIYFTNISYGKYGGRILATVYVDGFNLGDMLINQNLAKPYFGKKKIGFCK